METFEATELIPVGMSSTEGWSVFKKFLTSCATVSSGSPNWKSFVKNIFTLRLLIAALRDLLGIHPNWKSGPGASIVWDTGSSQQVYWPTSNKILSPCRKETLRIHRFTRLLLPFVNTRYALKVTEPRPQPESGFQRMTRRIAVEAVKELL